MKYRVHRFDLKMTKGEYLLEEFLNHLKGVVVAIVQNVAVHFLFIHRVDFLLIVEKVG